MEHRLEVNHWFFSSDLTFFIRGGRISKTAGFVGNVLNICPFMNVSNEGKLIVREKIRTKKKAIKEMLVKMQALCIFTSISFIACFLVRIFSRTIRRQ